MSNTATKIETFAGADNGLVRVQVWTGDIPGKCMTSSFYLDEREAHALIDRLQKAIATLPRIGTPADLGCDSL
jgi:hypothetical protein